MNPHAALGRRIRTMRRFSGVPLGTEGVIDEIYQLGERPGFMVAWDLPERPLPKTYRLFDGIPTIRSGILRDGFSEDELCFLEFVP